MLQLPYEKIIEKIKSHSNLSDEEINAKIKEKMEQLSDLVSKEGAAHIVANELGIKLFEQISGKIQIKNILTGMRNVELTAKVQNVFPVREFQNEKRSGKVGSFVAADETGTIRIVAWGDQADNVAQLKKDDIVRVQSGYVRDNNGMEVHLNEKSTLKINPPGETVEVNKDPLRKNLKDITGTDNNVEVLGTIVQAFDPRFFEVCPQCNRRAKEKEGVFVCDTHKTVTPDFSYVMNCVLDDGTETMRTVFFRNQMESLLNKKKDELLTLKDSPDSFQELKDGLVGTQIKLTGRAKRNQMFDRVELIADSVDTNPDPKVELQRIEKESPKPPAQVEEVVE